LATTGISGDSYRSHIFQMWVNYKKKKNVARKRVPRSGRALVVKASKTNLRKTVKAVVKSLAENKRQSYAFGNTGIRGVADASFTVTNILPVGFQSGGLVIPQGTSQGTRIGNKISLVSHKLKMIFWPLPYSASTNLTPTPCEVRIVCFYDKQSPLVSPTPTSDFFQYGGSDAGFANALTDQLRDPNLDRYRVVVDKKIKLGYADASGNGIQASSQSMTNNDFKLNQKVTFELAKFFPKSITWDDNTSSTSTTHGMYVMVIPTKANNVAIANAEVQCAFAYDIETIYQDL